jgi:alpha-L-fucosidase 2
MKLWYRRPASGWLEALPVGNGRLGAMVFGGVEEERITLNEDTLWSGEPYDTNDYDAVNHLDELRRLVQERRYVEADEVARKMQGPYGQSYQPLGDLLLSFDHGGEVSEYRRELDLDEAVAKVGYRAGDVLFTRQVFSTAVEDVMVVRLECDAPGGLSLSAGLESPLRSSTTPAAPDCLILRGRCPEHVAPNYLKLKDPARYGEKGIRFEVRLQAITESGSVSVDGDRLRVEGADAVTLLISAATSYDGFDRSPSSGAGEPGAACEERLAAAKERSYEELRAAHVTDHRKLFRRVELDLGSGGPVDLPTDERLEALREGNRDPQLVALYFQYGRYLLISGSRPGTQPANLQGIWNDQTVPPWSSNWTLNINAQMNYWPAEVCNLSECHEPLFDLIDELRVNGRKTARAYYGCGGWVAHHNTDLWRTSAPVGEGQGLPCWTSWPMGAGWLCSHLWEHYAFSGDEDFLAGRAYPVMKEAAEFFLDFLIEDESGHLLTCPSTSPENRFLTTDGEAASVSAAATMDLQIIRDLFTHCVEACRILDTDADFAKRLEEAMSRLGEPKVGRHGQLQEWIEDFDEAEPGHRHMSHLFGLYPGDQINPRKTPKLASAARTALERRLAHGGGQTGWSRAWTIGLWARLREGDLAHEGILRLLDSSTAPNMFDLHPPELFQIDGNFGATAGIAEMLVQSHAGEVELLPALPSAWPDGRVRGLRARGGLEVDIEWREGLATSATLRAGKSGTRRFRLPHGQRIVEIRDKAGREAPLVTEDGGVSLLVEEGYLYKIKAR